MNTKRKRPAIFPNHMVGNPVPNIPQKPYFVTLGANFRIGNPTNADYLFLWSTLKQKIAYLHKTDLPSEHMVDQVVTITGILKQENDTYITILERRDKNEFYTGLRRIYADIDKAIVAKELISL